MKGKAFYSRINRTLNLWKRIEAVITALTRNQVARKGSWVRIPPLPLKMPPKVIFRRHLSAYQVVNILTQKQKFRRYEQAAERIANIIVFS